MSTSSWSDYISDDSYESSSSSSIPNYEISQYYLPHEIFQFSSNFIHPPHKRTFSLGDQPHKPMPLVSKEPENNISFIISTFNQHLESNEQKTAYAYIEQQIESLTNAKDKSKLLKTAAESCIRYFLYSQAEQYYKSAMTFDPYQTQIDLDFAKFYDERGEFKKAESILKSGLLVSQKAQSNSERLIDYYLKYNKLSSLRFFFGSTTLPIIRILGSFYEIFRGTSNSQSILRILLDSTSPSNSLIKSISESKILNSKPSIISQILQLFKCYLHSDYVHLLSQLSLGKFHTIPSIIYPYYETFTTLFSPSLELSKFKNVPKTVQQKLEFILVNQLAKLGFLSQSRFEYSTIAASTSSDQRYRVFYNAALTEYRYGDRSFVSLLLFQAAKTSPSKTRCDIMIALVKFD